MISTLDLPHDAFFKPQPHVVLVYKWEPGRGWISQGYSKPKVQTNYQHLGDLMALSERGYRTVSWVAWNGEWVRL
jgi:hypothetical protein